MTYIFVGLMVIIGSIITVALSSYLLGCMFFRDNPFKADSFNDSANWLLGIFILIWLVVIGYASYHLGYAIIN